jgi:hypothetical protein
MGRAADPWRAAETWIRCLASHSVPLHATAGLSAHPDLAHLPAEPGICNRHDRSWRSRSAIGRASCSRPQMDRASCPMRYEGAGWRPLRVYRAIIDLAPVPPYRSSNLTDWRAPHNGSMPVPPPPTTLGGRTRWTSRRLSPYRSRASPRRKLPGFKNFARPTATARARTYRPHSTVRLYCTSATNDSLKNQ